MKPWGLLIFGTIGAFMAMIGSLYYQDYGRVAWIYFGWIAGFWMLWHWTCKRK